MESLARDQLIQRAADGELTTAEELAAFERHLAESPAAGVAVEDLRRLRAAVQRVLGSEVEVPAELRERIQRAMAAAAPVPVMPLYRRRWFVPSGLAAGILLLVGVSFVFSFLTNNVTDVKYGSGFRIASESGVPADWVTQSGNDASGILYDRFGSDYSNGFSLKAYGYDFKGIKDDSEMFASLALHYERSTDPGQQAVLWMVQRSEVKPDSVIAELNSGIAYQFSDTTTADGTEILRGCLAWQKGEIIYIFRVDAGADEDEQIGRLARALGMPDGELETIP